MALIQDNIIFFSLGFIFLVFGGDYFLDSIIYLSRKTGIPNYIIGATIVSFATTLPELLVSVKAAISDSPSMAFGNSIGSYICNTGLILGISMLFITSRTNKSMKIKTLLLLFTSLLVFAFLYDLVLSQVEGIILLIIFIIYITYNVIISKKMILDTVEKPEFDTNVNIRYIYIINGVALLLLTISIIINVTNKNLHEFNISYGLIYNIGIAILFIGCIKLLNKLVRKNVNISNTTTFNISRFIIGISMIVIGSNLLVSNGIVLASILGIPESIIGLTVIALGTSLPELTTAITSIVKKEYGLALGNVVGANIINITLIFGSVAIASKGANVPVGEFTILGKLFENFPQTLYLDLVVAILFAILLFVNAVFDKFNKKSGVIFLLIYLSYLTALILFFM